MRGTTSPPRLGILGTSREIPRISEFRSSLPTGYDRLGEATNLPQDRHDNTLRICRLAFVDNRPPHPQVRGRDPSLPGKLSLRLQRPRDALTFNPFYTAQVSTSASGVVNAVTNTGNSIADLLARSYPYTASVSRSFAGIYASTVAGLESDFNQPLCAG